MQNIKIWLMNENYSFIEKSDINFVPVMKALWSVEDCKKYYPFLVGIDPYGNTYFNVHQALKIIEELESLKKEEMSEVVLKEIDDCINFLKKVEQRTFANFIGD